MPALPHLNVRSQMAASSSPSTIYLNDHLMTPRDLFRLSLKGCSILLFVGALLCVLGAKLTVIDRYGSDLPYLDQWGKEADFIIGPFGEGNPAWLQGFLAPHNEHRIYFTTATNLLLTLVSGQWDARQQCIVSALLHALIAASLAVFAWRRLPRPFGAIVSALIIALAAVPLVWNNVLWGFQSEFYFLIGLSLVGIDGSLRRQFSARWWIGIAAMAAALVSMGSGFFGAAVIIPVLLRDVLARTRGWRAAWPTLTIALGIVVLGWHFHFAPPWHASLRPRSIGDFLAYAAHCLAWPLTTPIAAALFYLPLILLTRQWLRRGARAVETAHVQRFTVAAGAWVLLQVAALSYARGSGGGFPANRYGDILALGVIANAFALALLATPIQRRRWTIWASAWFAVLLCASAAKLNQIYRDDLPRHRREARAFEATVRAYVANGDAPALRRRPIPFLDYDWFIRILDRWAIRAVLPPSVSYPPRVSALSTAAVVLTRTGWFVLAVGLCALSVAALRCRFDTEASMLAARESSRRDRLL